MFDGRRPSDFYMYVYEAFGYNEHSYPNQCFQWTPSFHIRLPTSIRPRDIIRRRFDSPEGSSAVWLFILYTSMMSVKGMDIRGCSPVKEPRVI